MIGDWRGFGMDDEKTAHGGAKGSNKYWKPIVEL